MTAFAENMGIPVAPHEAAEQVVKTPDELIRALERRSHNELANRIKAVEQGIQWAAASSLDDLKGLLSASELNEIRKALPDVSGIEDMVKSAGNGIKEAGEFASTMASAPEALEGIAKKLGDSASDLGDIPEATKEKGPLAIFGVMAAKFSKIWNELKAYLAQNSFGKWLLGLFGVDASDHPQSKSAGESNGSAADSGKGSGLSGKLSESKEAILSDKQKIVGSVLYRISGVRKETTADTVHVPAVLYDSRVSSRSYAELVSLLQSHGTKPEGFASRLGLWKGFSDEACYYAVRALQKNEKLIGHLSSKDGDWKTKTIAALFAELAPHLNWFDYFKPIKSLEDLKAFDLTPFHFNREEGRIEGPFADRLRSLRESKHPGLTLRVVRYLEITAEKQPIDNFQSGDTDFNEDEKRFIQELTAYGSAMEQTLISRHALGLSGEVGKMFKSSRMRMGEALHLFILTGGKSSGLSPLEEGYAHFKLAGMIRARNEDVLLGEYYSSLAKAIAGKSDRIQLPEEVKNVVSSVIGTAEDVAMNWIIGQLKVAGGIAINNPVASTAAVASVVAIFLLLPKVGMLSAVTMSFRSLIAGMLIATWVVAAKDKAEEAKIESKIEGILKSHQGK